MSDFKGDFLGTFYGRDIHEADLQDSYFKARFIISMRDNFNFNPEMVATNIVNIMEQVFLLKQRIAELEGKK